MAAIEYEYKREQAFVQAELDFHNDEDYGELFRKPARVELLTKIKEDDRIETKPKSLV